MLVPPPTSGTFLSFEGIDGSGKSTQARLLVDALRARGHEVVAVREPGGTPLGESVRSLLLDPETHVSPRAEALLFSAARAQLVSAVIEPALARGAVVVADRFADSTEAYQGAGRDLQTGTALLEAVSTFATAGRTPTRTYLVQVPLDVALGRRSNRSADRMESAGDAFLSRVADAYDRLARHASDRVVRVNGHRPIQDVHDEILADVLVQIGPHNVDLG
jgi:dTMP kinase